MIDKATQKPMPGDLARAVRRADEGAVEELLLNGANVCEKDEYGMEMLPLAACCGYTEIVALLIAHGAEVNKPDFEGDTPLIKAAMSGAAETAHLLIAKGANVNAANKKGATALMTAALWGCPKTLSVLLGAGADINATNNTGSTALLYTLPYIEGEQKEALCLLLDSGADITIANNEGLTILILAERMGREEFLPPLRAAEEVLRQHEAKINSHAVANHNQSLVSARTNGYVIRRRVQP